MFHGFCIFADLLTHKNLDIVAEACRFIEVTAALADYNLHVLVGAGAINHLADLMSTVMMIKLMDKSTVNCVLLYRIIYNYRPIYVEL